MLLYRIDGGYKGVDPVGNIACLNVDFLSLHICKSISPKLLAVLHIMPYPMLYLKKALCILA